MRDASHDRRVFDDVASEGIQPRHGLIPSVDVWIRLVKAMELQKWRPKWRPQFHTDDEGLCQPPGGQGEPRRPAVSQPERLRFDLPSSGDRCEAQFGLKCEIAHGRLEDSLVNFLARSLNEVFLTVSGSRLQRELRKKGPFDSVEQEATLNILRTSDLLQNRLGRLLREYGLTSSQYNVLRILRGEGQPLPSLEIRERMVQVVPAITGLIDRLQKQGLVQRRRCEADRRVIYVELTATATRLLKRIDKPLAKLHQQLCAGLDRQELKTLSRLTEKLRAHIEQEADSGN